VAATSKTIAQRPLKGADGVVLFKHKKRIFLFEPEQHHPVCAKR
jgi:hypothetical protein